jgi:predicted  nucleic acid-binding Zn-ribbon protein
MSFLDKVTKAVGGAVDKGKREVDQFVRIQKINGQIGEIEKKIAGFKDQIQQTKVQVGEKAVEMLRAGTLASPDLQAMVDQITGIEKQIAAEQAAIVEKKAEIEKIKAEDEAQAAAEAAQPQPAAPTAAPPAAPAVKFCPKCGAPAGTTPFCSQCGTKLA